MSVTVGILSSWRPFALEAAGDALESARGRLDATVGELETAVRVAENAWEGDAALAALERLREHTRTGQPLVETLTVLRGIVKTCGLGVMRRGPGLLVRGVVR